MLYYDKNCFSVILFRYSRNVYNVYYVTYHSRLISEKFTIDRVVVKIGVLYKFLYAGSRFRQRFWSPGFTTGHRLKWAPNKNYGKGRENY